MTSPPPSEHSRRHLLKGLSAVTAAGSLAGCVDQLAESITTADFGDDETDEKKPTGLEAASAIEQTRTLFEALAWATDSYGTAISAYRDAADDVQTAIADARAAGTVDQDQTESLAVQLDTAATEAAALTTLYPNASRLKSQLHTYQDEVTDRFPDEPWSHESFLDELDQFLATTTTAQYINQRFPIDPLQGTVLEALSGGTPPEQTVFEVLHTGLADENPPPPFKTQTLAGNPSLTDRISHDAFDAPNGSPPTRNPTAFHPLLDPTDRHDRIYVTVAQLNDPDDSSFIQVPALGTNAVPMAIQRYTTADAATAAYSTLLESYDTSPQDTDLRLESVHQLRYQHPAERAPGGDPSTYHTLIAQNATFVFCIGARDRPFEADSTAWITPLQESWLTSVEKET